MISLLQTLGLRRGLPPVPEPQIIHVDGKAIILRVRRSVAARRMILRLDPKSGGLVMTLPKRIGLAEALRFVEHSRDWITRTLAKQPIAAKFEDGVDFLYLGINHKIRLTGGARGVVHVLGEEIYIPGKPEHAARRLKDFLSAEAKRELLSASRRYASAMDTKFTRISIRDQKTRWGSCSAAGVLSYSWRLILAPAYVLDYVAAHEVAHLREMNHGPRFWRLVLTHCSAARNAKQWLKAHGKDVHRHL